MSNPNDDRDARLAELLDQARDELRDSGRFSETLLNAPDHGLANAAADLMPLVLELQAAAHDWKAGAGTPPPAAPMPPALGRYVVEAPISSGGMGTVFRAHDPELNRTVAIKVPKFEGAFASQAEMRKRFVREARAAAAVRHPNVCPIYDVGEQDGVPFVVMALIDGQTLADLVAAGPLDMGRARELARKIALGLEAVHANKIVHRDLKPRNVLIDAAGEPHLTDFGLSRPEADAEQLTSTGAIIGTPAYMAPEQVEGASDKIGPRTDVYAVGVMLYQMLTGSLPFTGTAFTLVHQITHAAPPAPSTLRPEIDPALERVVLKAMARAPEERFASARALADAVADPESRTHVEPRRPARPRRSRTRLILLAAAVLALVVLTPLGYLGVKRLTRPDPGGIASPGPGGPTGTVIVFTQASNWDVVIKRNGQVVVPRTRERRFTLPAGDHDFELWDSSISRLVMAKSFTVEPGEELELDAMLDAVMVQPEDPTVVREVLEWVLSHGKGCWIQGHTQEFKFVTVDAVAKLPPPPFFVTTINLPDQKSVRDSDLARLRRLNNIDRLVLDGTSITDAGLDHLQPRWPLRSLSFVGTSIGDPGLDKLKKFRKLRQIDLTQTRVTAEGASRLRKAIPSCEVIWNPR